MQFGVCAPVGSALLRLVRGCCGCRSDSSTHGPRLGTADTDPQRQPAEPEVLGAGLPLLMEGAFASGQLFGERGPARSVAAIADRLIADMTPKRG